ncbi:MAG: arylsulfatase A-like enzyme [Verrucomicrobiales bacterium]|jgi:arylsulfatase A-like enzyme
MFRLALLFCLVTGAISGAQDKPNILFIAVDDLNDWISPLGGHPQAQTPNITRLADRGMLFSNAHCAAPACNPSRAALMTGIRPSTSGVYVNPLPWRLSDRLKEAQTLPQYLRTHGYSVIGSGKMFHDAYPDPASWDTYFPALEKQRPADPAPENRPLNGMGKKTAHFDWGPVDAEASDMSDAKVADWVVDQLGKDHEKPLFLACGFYRPHLPWYVPAKYFERYPLDKIELPKSPDHDLEDVPKAGLAMAKPKGDHARVLKHNQWKQAVQGYLACISFMDDQLGRVLDALDKGPMAKDTIIVFWTDHGWHLGEKKHWRKFALWEEATRTPVIIAAPEVTKGKTRSDQPISLMDLYPTIVELVGLPAKEDNEGHSLVTLLKDPAAAWEHIALTTHGKGNHAVRDQRWRYIRYADGTDELYDHASDPNEYKNLASDADLAKVKERLAAHFPKVNVPESPRDKR